MKYIPPFEALKRFVHISAANGEVRISASYDEFQQMLRLLLSAVEFDEAWYRRQYEDIDQAIRAGRVASARQHFLDDGYFEGRLPRPVAVDEGWYLATYPDVADGIRLGEFRSAEHHFQEDGCREGRLPHAV